LALAQPTDQPPPPTAPTPDAPPAPPPEPPPAAAAEASPAATVEDRLTTVEGKLEGMEEANAANGATLDGLRKLKFSGYIQGRYEWHDDAGAGLDADGRATRGTNRFLVRRARLKTTYAGTMSEFMLQIDAVPDGVTVKDAEATLVLDDTVIPAAMPWEVRLTVGQFKAPFGFEVLQSSGDREMPERARMIRVLFPGERDRGVRLQARAGVLRLSTALINGNVFPALASFKDISTSSSDVITGTIDQSSFKDLVGRLAADLEFLVVGASVYYGHTIFTTPAKAASGMMPATPASYQRFRRLRLGADAQAYVDIPALGGLVLRGEFAYAPEKNIDYSGTVADPCKDVKAIGWIATLVQNIGDHFAVVFRADQFDRNSDVADSCMAAVKDPAAIDKVTTLGGGFLVHVSGNLKATAVYEHVGEQGVEGKHKKDNDVLTLQLQAKF
jgi:hypothetical protein